MLRPTESMKKAVRKYVSAGRGWTGFFEDIGHFFYLSHFTDFKETHTRPYTSCIHNKNYHLNSVLYGLSDQTSPFSLKGYVK